MDNTVSGAANSAVGSANLNQAAAHDTSLYDPTIHDNQIVALYDTDGDARAAQQVLMQSGFPEGAVRVMARDAGETAETAAYEDAQEHGLWGAIRSLFVPDEDRTTYNHAIARGHSMLVVTPDGSMDRQHLVHVIESTGPLDFDAKLEEWRQTGYDSSAAMTRATVGGEAGPVETGPGTVATGAPNSGVSTGPEATLADEAARRTGRRDAGVNTPRVRSYISERAETGYAVQGRAQAEGTLPASVGGNPNATPGAGSSGMNSPRG